MAAPVEELSKFSHRLAENMDSGNFSMITALEDAVKRETTGNLRETLKRVTENVRIGIPLSLSMARHPDVFNATYLGLLRHGEISGSLEEVLYQLGRTVDLSAALNP